MSTHHTLILLSVLLAVVVVAVLAVALHLVQRGLRAAATDLSTLAGALTDVEATHLRPLEPAVIAINAQFDTILGALPGIAAKAAVVAEEEAVMTLLWIGDAVLLLVVVPVVIVLLRRVLSAVSDIVPAIEQIGEAAAALSRDLDAAPLLLTTQDQVARTVAAVADYGGSLNVIVDDAPQEALA